MKTLKSVRPTTAALVILSAAFAALVVLPACETVKGAGQDLQNASNATERAISK